MDVVFISLEALILKATHEALPQPDSAATEAFCSVLRDSPEGRHLATRALAARIQSHNAKEAMLALTMLDRCMRRCDAGFHAEVGKFRFLNEMIKLVSPKYYADRTAPEVRTRILQLLHSWTIDFPKETKFKVAYEMLKNQGVVTETPPPLPPEDTLPLRARAKSAVFEDEEKSKLLQKLLQSKKPEDLQHANRLIKTMVREEEKRCGRMSEVSSAMDRVALLRELLQHAGDASHDEMELIHELHASCQGLHPTLQHLASSTPDNDPAIETILQANTELVNVFEKYNEFLAQVAKPQVTKPTSSGADSLLDLAGPTTTISQQRDIRKDTMDALGDIFSTETVPAASMEPIKPMNLMQSDDVDLVGSSMNTEGATSGWGALDSLGEQLLKQSLPEYARRPDGFTNKTKKVPMNALEKMSPTTQPQDTPLLNTNSLLDLDFFTNESSEPTSQTLITPSKCTDDIMVDITMETTPAKVLDKEQIPKNPLDSILDLNMTLEAETASNQTPNKPEASKTDPLETIIKTNQIKPCDTDNLVKNSVKLTVKSDIKPLTDVNVTLDSVRPSSVPPVTALEDESGVTIVLHFAKNRPRPDTYVVVISTTSRSEQSIEDYKFQPVLPKTCKWRLLPPSGTSLPAYNPFLPPPALTQLLLIAAPPQTPITLKFAVTYTSEQEDFSEMGEVKNLPLELIKD